MSHKNEKSKKRPRTDEENDTPVEKTFFRFQDLPVEIAVKCLEYLKSKDRRKYRLVSRKSQELIDSHPSLQREYLYKLLICYEDICIEKTRSSKSLRYPDFISIRHKLLNCHIKVIHMKSGIKKADGKRTEMLQQLVDIFKAGNLSVHDLTCSVMDQSDALINDLLECAQPRKLGIFVSKLTSIRNRVFKIPSRCESLSGYCAHTDATYDLSTAKRVKSLNINGFDFKIAPHSNGVFSTELVQFFRKHLPRRDGKDYEESDSSRYKELHDIGYKAKINPREKPVLIVTDQEHFII